MSCGPRPTEIDPGDLQYWQVYPTPFVNSTSMITYPAYTEYPHHTLPIFTLTARLCTKAGKNIKRSLRRARHTRIQPTRNETVNSRLQCRPLHTYIYKNTRARKWVKCRRFYLGFAITVTDDRPSYSNHYRYRYIMININTVVIRVGKGGGVKSMWFCYLGVEIEKKRKQRTQLWPGGRYFDRAD